VPELAPWRLAAGTSPAVLSCSSQLRHVIGVINDNEEETRRTLWTAIQLADTSRARLTLVKTCDVCAVFAAFGPLGMQAALAPPDSAAREVAGRRLARVASIVPGHIPLTTMVLGSETQQSLRRLLGTGAYDALVAPAELIEACPKLARDIRRDGVQAVSVY
jgi:hypothetical protein